MSRILEVAVSVALVAVLSGCSGQSVEMPASAAAQGPILAQPGRSNDFRESIAAVIEGADATLGALPAAERADLRTFYQPDGAPRWLGADGQPTRSLREALDAMSHAADDGLDSTEYFPELIERSMPQPGAASPSREDRARLDVAVSAAMLRYTRDLHTGRVDPRSVGFGLEVAHDRRRCPDLLRAALAEGRIASFVADMRPRLGQYRALRSVLPRYRMLADGAHVHQIGLSLERLRWLPDPGGTRLIVLNIPMFRLWAWDADRSDDAPAFGMDAIVGRAQKTQTPVLAAMMNEVIFRPYWNVPPSILQHEVLPKLEADPDYLRKQGMEIVETEGGFRVRQQPGPKNALGLIKFVFPNAADVYMHGTPAQALFAKKRRDFSHGCVRVADPVALAEWVLQDQAEWTRARIVAATEGHETIEVRVPRPVQVVLFYATAAVMPEDGTIRFADDIYRYDARLDAALAEVHRERLSHP